MVIELDGQELHFRDPTDEELNELGRQFIENDWTYDEEKQLNVKNKVINKEKYNNYLAYVDNLVKSLCNDKKELIEIEEENYLVYERIVESILNHCYELYIKYKKEVKRLYDDTKNKPDVAVYCFNSLIRGEKSKYTDAALLKINEFMDKVLEFRLT